MSKHPLHRNSQVTSIKTKKADAARRDEPPAAAPIIHTVPNDPNDPEQDNLVSVEEQLDGLPVTIPLWPNAAEFAGEFDLVIARIDNFQVFSEEFEGPITDDVDIVVRSARLRSHGPKQFTYSVGLSGAPDVATSLPITVFVDTIDPNNNLKPNALLLPLDLPSNGVTPEYLVTHGGVTLTLPRPIDSRSGDTFKIFYGSGDPDGQTGTVPLTGPITYTFTTAQINASGPGDFLLDYQFFDRAGNDTQISIPRTLSVRLSDPPVLVAPVIPMAAPLVDKEEAREGVLVSVPAITGFLPNDVVHIFWNGIEFGTQRLGVTPIFPFEFVADYATIAAGGSDYTATVNYEVQRGTDNFPSPNATVDVNLVEPGTPVVGPGPIDPSLALPVVRGDSAVNNSLIATDLAGVITATFLIYEGHAAGEFIDLYYGMGEGDLASTYTVLGTEADTFVVTLPIAAGLIEKYGNGEIPCWYRVRNAINYKQSRAQDVRVDVFALTGLADPIFTNLFTDGSIRCPQTPWVNVPIRVFDPVSLKDGDRVVISAVRYEFVAGELPVVPVPGTAVDSPELGVGPAERLNGFTYNFVLPYFDGDATRRRGWVEVMWSIIRDLPAPERGSSDPVVVLWDIRSGAVGGTCVPTTLRGSLV
ncbi:hypothetical protein HX836_26185 [Pseudomonas yamanorum]|uniref:hypothetical protein n=1 Tax=Pseudomonas yamanorum TaxID=515393 RepID=UPI0015A07D4C|nr:hypothetical protein [Pseudomonas yamanorum]NVZ85309.1 hypothetical protein [Pseudomonas yamanorum]